MASKYDPPDPSADDDNALAPDYHCDWCGAPCDDTTYPPYCDSICALEAERDSTDTDVKEDS